MKLNPDQPLYLISDGGRLRKAGLLVSRIQEALQAARGRIGIIQLREQVIEEGENPTNAASDDEVIGLVRTLKPICEQYGARLLVNRRVDLALEASAHGVHLNAYSAAVEKVRAILGERPIIGFSAHNLTEAQYAQRQGADYLLFSPVFPPQSKPSIRAAVGPLKLAQLISDLQIPVFGLGGIKAENVSLCRQAGAFGVAVIGAVFGGEHPAIGARELLDAWDEIPRLLH